MYVHPVPSPLQAIDRSLSIPTFPQRIALEILIALQEVEDVTVDALLEEKVQKNKPRPAPAPTHTEDVLLSSAPSYEVVVETAIPPSEPSQTSNAVDRTPSPSAPLLQSDSLTATIEITPAPVSELSPSIQAVIPGDSLSQQEQVHEENVAGYAGDVADDAQGSTAVARDAFGAGVEDQQ
ncbi:hypothetical protein D9756_010170 [Leucocoprinus leucothites]|uniref:Uncharacterized protein n=1 Tax=Leucocoprinus leucothites TaxID=201217 RepID=A0A8H5CV56_9AGAR|nr:hypothetical protein D9756_010170 [Leucoagaricus leucothites]